VKKGLGKGLGALFDAPMEELSPESGEDLKGIREIPVNKIEPGSGQPRQNFSPEALSELSESIALHGIIQPLTVRHAENGRFEIVAGERRWRAAKLAGLKTVPVIIKDYDDRQAREAALVENLQRENLNPVEEAMGYKSLMDEYKLTQEQAAARVGKSRPVVANALRLLSLPPKVLSLVKDGTLSAGHARTLLSLSDKGKIETIADVITRKSFSVRETESLVKKENAPPPKDKAPAPPGKDSSFLYYKEVEKELSEAAGRRVVIRETGKKGTIELEYYGPEDREALIEKLRRL